MDPAKAVFDAIAATTTQDPTRIVAATQALEEVEKTVPGAFNILFVIAAQRDLPLDIRKQAIFRVYRQATSVWRRTSIFNPTQKQEFRNQIFAFLDEPDDTIANYNALIVSKVARIDYPVHWPDLFEKLKAALESNWPLYFNQNPSQLAGLALRRTLEILNQAVKELVSMRTPQGSVTLRQVSLFWSPPLSEIYEHFASTIFGSLNLESVQNLQMAEALRIGHLAFKCLSRLMCWFWSKHHQADFSEGGPLVETFFQRMLERIPRLHELRKSLTLGLSANPAAFAAGWPTHTILTKHVLRYGTTARQLAVVNVSKFTSLPGSTDLVLLYWGIITESASADPSLMSEEKSAVYPTKIVIQGLILMKETLKHWSPTKKGVSPDAVLNAAFVTQAVEILITRFLPLSPSDLQKWEGDPEEWINSEGEVESATWEFDLRPCAERLAITFVANYSSYVAPLLLLQFNLVNKSIESADLQTIIQAEAIYCAFGVGMHHLKNEVDFESWVRNYAQPIALSPNPSYRILKRRIAWLIGNWVHDFAPHFRTGQVWQVLLHLLHDHGNSTDMAVRLTATIALQRAIDSVDSTEKEELFTKHLEAAIRELLQLLTEVDAVKSKRSVATTLAAVVAVSRTKIISFVPAILPAMSQLWASEQGSETSIRTAVLELVNTMVKSCREQSIGLADAVVPLVQDSLTCPQKAQLDQEAFPLWQSALRMAVDLDPRPGSQFKLMDLLPLAVEKLGGNLDVMGSMVSIVKSYIILDAGKIFQTCGKELCQAVLTVSPHAASANGKEAVIMLNCAIQVCPPALWAGAMHESGLFGYLIKELINDKTKLPRLTLVEIVLLFSRMLLSDATVFIQLIQATSGPEWDRQENRLYEGLLDQYWNKFDSMGHPQPRKLVAMALAAFVSTGRKEVLGRLNSEIINVWVDVMCEMREASNSSDDENPLTTYWKTSEQEVVVDLDVEGTVEEQRLRELARRDPVLNVQLTTFIREHLARTEAYLGGPQALQAFMTDPDNNASLQRELNWVASST
ncbi:ran binding protein 11 [Auriculariales sp. MPI-PUGE-AT-0066]|nr:ran binding protein 11 [Auriculariales sp. MPI-PUGE-AT-0066]